MGRKKKKKPAGKDEHEEQTGIFDVFADAEDESCSSVAPGAHAASLGTEFFNLGDPPAADELVLETEFLALLTSIAAQASKQAQDDHDTPLPHDDVDDHDSEDVNLSPSAFGTSPRLGCLSNGGGSDSGVSGQAVAGGSLAGDNGGLAVQSRPSGSSPGAGLAAMVNVSRRPWADVEDDPPDSLVTDLESASVLRGIGASMDGSAHADSVPLPPRKGGTGSLGTSPRGGRGGEKSSLKDFNDHADAPTVDDASTRPLDAIADGQASVEGAGGLLQEHSDSAPSCDASLRSGCSVDDFLAVECQLPWQDTPCNFPLEQTTDMLDDYMTNEEFLLAHPLSQDACDSPTATGYVNSDTVQDMCKGPDDSGGMKKVFKAKETLSHEKFFHAHPLTQGPDDSGGLKKVYKDKDYGTTCDTNQVAQESLSCSPAAKAESVVCGFASSDASLDSLQLLVHSLSGTSLHGIMVEFLMKSRRIQTDRNQMMLLHAQRHEEFLKQSQRLQIERNQLTQLYAQQHDELIARPSMRSSSSAMES